MRSDEQFVTSGNEPDKEFINNMFSKYNDFLVERMDPDSGILDKLFSRKTLTREEMQDIKLSGKTTYRKNRKLLQCIATKNKAWELVVILEDANQEHLAKYLKADGKSDSSDIWPLTEKELNILISNHETLIDSLETTDLITCLYSKRVLNNRQRDLIASKPTPAERNDALLDIMSRYSLRQFRETIRCLYKSNQSHIAEILCEGGAVVPVQARLLGDPSVIVVVEDELFTKLTDLLRKETEQNFANIRPTPDDNNIKFFSVKRTDSLTLNYRCIGAKAITRLLNKLNSGELQREIDSSFRYMLPSDKHVFTLKLCWSEELFRMGDPLEYIHSAETQVDDEYESYYTCDDEEECLPRHEKSASVDSKGSSSIKSGIIMVIVKGFNGITRCLQIEKNSSVDSLISECGQLFGVGEMCSNIYFCYEGGTLKSGSTMSLEQAGIRNGSIIDMAIRTVGGCSI